jgi:hypothetical protein
MGGDAQGVRLIALHVGLVGPPASKPGELCTVAADARDELRTEAGDRGIAGHGAGDDDEQVGLLADRADLVGSRWNGRASISRWSRWWNRSLSARGMKAAPTSVSARSGRSKAKFRVEDTHAHAAWVLAGVWRCSLPG